MTIQTNGECKHVLQRSVPKHDPVEGQGPGDGILLHELHEGEAGRLRLVAGHAHKLDVTHLLEELQQLLGSGGLQREVGRGRGERPSGTRLCGREVATYLRVEVADVHGPPDLVDFGRVDVAHERRLGRDRGGEVQTGRHPVHYGEVQLENTHQQVHLRPHRSAALNQSHTGSTG